MDLPLAGDVFSVVFGLVIGSFLNVCIYRIPEKKSIITPPSSCPYCEKRIRFYDNIPLLSYLFLRGRCRHCGRSISWQYPAVEGLTGLLSLFLYIRYGLSFQYLFMLAFVALLVAISFIDVRHQIIPDILSLPGILMGLGISLFWAHGFWLDSLIGSAAGGGALLSVAYGYEKLTGREGIGGGDIKLMAMIGAWVGWRALPLILLISSLTGAVIGTLFLLWAGKGYRARIPFGPFLSLAAVLHILWGNQLTRWYLGLFS